MLYLCISLLVAQCIAARLVLSYFLCVASINWWNILWLFIEKYCVNKVLFPIRSISLCNTSTSKAFRHIICMGWYFHSMLPFLLCGDWRRNDICLSNAPFYCRFIFGNNIDKKLKTIVEMVLFTLIWCAWRLRNKSVPSNEVQSFLLWISSVRRRGSS